MDGPQKMIITPYKMTGDSVAEDKANAFTVVVNPSSYQCDSQIKYNTIDAGGLSGASPTFNQVGNDNISFELLFDATGGVPLSDAAAKDVPANGVEKQIADFKKTVANYDGDKHKPPYVKICWASLVFRGVLRSLSLTYTLFRPSGIPLRARAKVSFSRFTTLKDMEVESKKASPDLSHLVEVKAGDTLPLLCYRIYGRSRYYHQVARANGLSGFRDIAPGTRLLFPPLGSIEA